MRFNKIISEKLPPHHGSNVGRRRANALSLMNSPARQSHRESMARIFQQTQSTITPEDPLKNLIYPPNLLPATPRRRAIYSNTPLKFVSIPKLEQQQSPCLPTLAPIGRLSEEFDESLRLKPAYEDTEKPAFLKSRSPIGTIPARPNALHHSLRSNEVVRPQMRRKCSSVSDLEIAIGGAAPHFESVNLTALEEDDVGDWTGDEDFYRPIHRRELPRTPVETWLAGITTDPPCRQSPEIMPPDTDAANVRTALPSSTPRKKPQDDVLNGNRLFGPGPLRTSILACPSPAPTPTTPLTRFRFARLPVRQQKLANVELTTRAESRLGMESRSHFESKTSSSMSEMSKSVRWVSVPADYAGEPLLSLNCDSDGAMMDRVVSLTPEVERYRKGKAPRRQRCRSYYDTDILPSSVAGGDKQHGPVSAAD